MKKSIEFKLKSAGDELEKLVQKSINFLEHHGYSDDIIHAQIMVLRELITRGQKFDDCSSSVFEMKVFLQIENDSITVEVKKSVNESTYGKLAELDKTIQWIRGDQDPFELYVTKRAETADPSDIAETSALGLTRIAYETNAMIDFYVSEDNILNLSAVRNFKADSIPVG